MKKLKYTLLLFLSLFLFSACADETPSNKQSGTITEKTRPDGLQAGLNIINTTTATFVLDDQDIDGNHSDSAHVLGSFNNWKQSDSNRMYWDSTNKCWWLTVTGLDPSAEYTYQYHMFTSSGKVDIADPYSTKVSDPNDKYISSTTYPNLISFPSQSNGICSTFATKSDTYDWKVTNFSIKNQNDLRIYELLLRDFTGDNNGIGNIADATNKLDYLKTLGINAVELMPVQEFGGNESWGYNPDFFFALDKAYGTTNEYKQFVDACHQRGLAVIMDVVYNQATDDFPYCKLYWDSTHSHPSSKSLWFNAVAPHSSLAYFDDFNHSSKCVQNYIIRNLKYMMSEFKVDGFRFDFAKGFTQTVSTSDATLSAYDASRIAILKTYSDAVHSANPNAAVILELFGGTAEEQELAKDNMKLWRNMNYNYCQSAMGYPSSSNFTYLYSGASDMPGSSEVSYMESHDEERAAYKQETWGVSSIKGNVSEEMKQLSANACFFLTVPGPKMMWMFEEMGYDVSKGSDTSKRPNHWEYLNDADRAGLHDVYMKLNTLRTNNPELFSDAATFSWKVGDTDWSTGRFITLASSDGNKHLVVAGNFDASTNTLNVAFPHTGIWYDYLNGNQTVTVSSATENIAFPMHTAKVYVDFDASSTTAQ